MIKFRLICKNEIVGYEKHEKYGSWMFVYLSKNNKDWYDIRGNGFIFCTSKDQFIKLDKHGKEIYEGDDVEAKTMIGESDTCKNVSLTKLLPTEFFIFQYNSKNLKLIGNPYKEEK